LLKAVELFPSPPPGAKRFLRLRELQDLLMTRGVKLVEHRFSGSSQVVILGPEDNVPTPSGRALSASSVQRAEARGSPEGPSLCTVDAGVRPIPGVVVAAKSLARGAVIRAVDVQIEEGETLDPPVDGFRSIDQVIGRETTRAIPAGERLRGKWTRQPLLVRRGEVITVCARSAGVRVRTLARAREDGSLADLIEVESLRDRARYFAQVSGIQEAEVFARPIQAQVATAPGSVGDAKVGIASLRSKGQGAWSRKRSEPGPQVAARPRPPSIVPLDLEDKMRNLYPLTRPSATTKHGASPWNSGIME
jgi:flagella basal body P-ring formation protein FlgA